MKRGLIVIATLYSITACSAQQVQDAALYTVGAAIGTAIAIDKAMDNDDERNCVVPDQTDPIYPGDPIGQGSPDVLTSCDALLEADREARAAQRRAELNAALDAYNTGVPGTESGERSVVMTSGDPVVPPEVVERFNAIVPKASVED